MSWKWKQPKDGERIVRTCPNCKGKCQVKEYYGEYEHRMVTCPECNGTGEVRYEYFKATDEWKKID